MARPLIWLVRHGETDFNREPARVQGHTDVPLNRHGRGQAAALADRIAGGGRPASVYTSHLLRARETAAEIGAAVGIEPVVDQRLAESRRGAWEGRLWDDIRREDPAAYAAWRSAGAGFRFPGGESLAEQMERVVACLTEVARAPDALPAVIACHGGTIRVALCHARRRGLDAFHDWDVPNGALIGL
ncbi:MAG: histidine phosphatase family protein [Solirubrobacteraceae bacterium]